MATAVAFNISACVLCLQWIPLLRLDGTIYFIIYCSPKYHGPLGENTYSTPHNLPLPNPPGLKREKSWRLLGGLLCSMYFACRPFFIPETSAVAFQITPTSALRPPLMCLISLGFVSIFPTDQGLWFGTLDREILDGHPHPLLWEEHPSSLPACVLSLGCERRCCGPLSCWATRDRQRAAFPS